MLVFLVLLVQVERDHPERRDPRVTQAPPGVRDRQVIPETQVQDPPVPRDPLVHLGAVQPVRQVPQETWGSRAPG